MKQIIYLISLIFIIFPVFSQEKITEKVEVDWWILPLFAVDQKGNSITDLEKSDIKIFVNNREIQEFTFLKRAYLESRPATLKPSSTSQAVLYRKKMIFLIFDLTISNPGT
ncbi:MAG: hypothetical protein KAT17_02780, partial [Candidatus Aminicenantes bacterium]|nr:hypothetical protein [Candidatus Aminicenantes bacterium]